MNDSRKRFEQTYLAENVWPTTIERGLDGEYTSLRAAFAWRIWQAAEKALLESQKEQAS